eukprot:s1844_g6.t1
MDAPPVVMKWLHSACSQTWFLNEWQAREDAAILADEVDSPCALVKFEVNQFPQRDLRRGRPKISFATDLDFAMYYPNEWLLHSTSVPVADFEQWQLKPWKLAMPAQSTNRHSQEPLSFQAVSIRDLPITEMKTTDQWHNVPSNWISDRDHAPDGAGEEDLFLHDASPSIQRLFDALQHGGLLAGQQAADTLYVRSWFIHHLHFTECHHPRVLEINGHWRFWMRDIIGGWRDLYQDNEELEIYIAHPDPPRPAQGRREFHLDIILVQGTEIPMWAGLITVLRQVGGQDGIVAALATSLPQTVSGYLLAIQAQQVPHCQLHGCQIWHGVQNIPFSHAPVHDMDNGDTFLIAVDFPDTDAAIAQPADLGQANQAANDLHDELRDRDDHASEHADDPSPSGTSIADDPQAVHIFRLGYPPAFGYVDWNTYYIILRDAAQTVGQPVSQYVGFHYPQVRLPGLHEGEEAILMQHVQDIPLGSYEKLIICDLEPHSNALQNGLPSPPRITRTVHKLPHLVARRHLLIAAKIDAYCTWMEDQCIVYLNNVLWHPRDHRLQPLEHGACLRILVPPPRRPEWDHGLAIRVIQDTADLFEFPEAASLAESILEAQIDGNRADFASIGDGQSGARLVHNKGNEDADPRDIPMMFAPGERVPPLRPPHDGTVEWLWQLGEIFAAQSEIETIDGDPLLYVQTWFVHHSRFAKCQQSRPVRLDGAAVGWIEELRFAWRDLLDHSLPFSIHVVRPRPPQLRLQSYACHLLLEQDARPGIVAGVVSNLFEGSRRDALQQFATSFPSRANAQQVVEELQLQPHCDTRRCTVSLGEQKVHLIVQADFRSGFNLCVRLHLPSNLQPELDAHGDPMSVIEHFADLHLFQTSLALQKQTLLQGPVWNGAVCDGLDLPWTRDEASSFTFNPAASPFRPNFGPIASMDEFTRNLHALWTSRAFSWEDEEPSACFLTWFTDHQGPFPHCTQPRLIRLYADFRQWQLDLRALWQDEVLPGVDLEMFIVSPPPPYLEAGITGHLLLQQRAQPATTTSLVTWTDTSIPPRFGQLLRMAITTPAPIHLSTIIDVIGYSQACLSPQAHLHCRGWYNDERLPDTRPFLRPPGRSIVLEIRPRRTPPTASVGLLQLHATKVTHKIKESMPVPIVLEELILDQPSAPIIDSSEVPLWLHGVEELYGRVPSHLTLPPPINSHKVVEELTAFGIHAAVVLADHAPLALCLPTRWPFQDDCTLVLFVNAASTAAFDETTFVHLTSEVLASELDYMKLLYQLDFEKAVILKGPAHLPACVLDLGITLEEIQQFFTASSGTICHSVDGLQLPEVTLTALHDLSHHTTFDRLIIYTDGSSQSHHRHIAPELNEEIDVPDAWSFVILGETYTDDGHELTFIGWCSHQVRCEISHPWHIGALRISSLIAEREALTWAMIWRLGLNSRIPYCLQK